MEGVQISMQPSSMTKAPAGWIIDSGKSSMIQGKYKYGWSNDNSKNAREASNKTGSLLNDTNIAFIPPRHSIFYPEWGNEEQQNNWLIELPNGK